MKTHALVVLGGGPSPVINASLLGVVEGCRQYPDHIGRVYGARHGLEGVLKEEIVDLSAQDPRELKLLLNTPASGSIGTCRYKLDRQCQEDFERIIAILAAREIGYFFCIGGNDTMDTADQVSALAREKGFDLVVTGVPKTIDNDLGDAAFTLIDHTPGYASAARYWANIIQTVNEENKGMCVSERVAVLQAMGRKSGYITAAARLADPERTMPLQLYFAEAGHNLATLTENVHRELRHSGRVIVVVNEGFDVGSLGEARDGFGHIEYGASQTTAAQVVVNHLNRLKFPVSGQATCQVPGVLQRCTAIHRSTVDIREAYEIGGQAVAIAVRDGTGFMATILRSKKDAYQPVYSKVGLKTMANSARFLPAQWITADGLDVTDDFIRYAQPLLGDGWPDMPMEHGQQRFARLDMTLLPPQAEAYTPVKHRGGR